MNNHNIKNIAVFSISGIGNTIFSVPLIRSLRRNYPYAHISVFVRFKASRDLLISCPFVDDVEVVDYSLAKSIWEKVSTIYQLRKKKFDLSIIAFPSQKREKNVFSFLVGAKLRISHKYIDEKFTNLGFLQNARYPVKKGIHDLEQNLNLLRLLNIGDNNFERKLEVCISKQDKVFAKKYLEKIVHNRSASLLIGFHPGSSSEFGMYLKRWDIKNFALLADRISKAYNAKVFIFGGPDEKRLKIKMAKLMKFSSILVETNSIRKDAALISELDMFISNDSGNMNLSLAMGTLTVGLFGPVDSSRANLQSENMVIIKSNAKCSPCLRVENISSPLVCPYSEPICMNSITVDSVYQIIGKKLDKIRRN